MAEQPDELDDILFGPTKRAGQSSRQEVDDLIKSHGDDVGALFDTVKWAEGGQPDLIVGGKERFDVNGDHPNKVGLTTAAGDSTAAGNYQITGSNWYGRNGQPGLKARLGVTRFGPDEQYRAAVMMANDAKADKSGKLLRGKGEFGQAVASGNYDRAREILAQDWTSTPGSTIGGGGQKKLADWQSQFDANRGKRGARTSELDNILFGAGNNSNNGAGTGQKSPQDDLDNILGAQSPPATTSTAPDTPQPDPIAALEASRNDAQARMKAATKMRDKVAIKREIDGIEKAITAAAVDKANKSATVFQNPNGTETPAPASTPPEAAPSTDTAPPAYLRSQDGTTSLIALGPEFQNGLGPGEVAMRDTHTDKGPVTIVAKDPKTGDWVPKSVAQAGLQTPIEQTKNLVISDSKSGATYSQSDNQKGVKPSQVRLEDNDGNPYIAQKQGESYSIQKEGQPATRTAAVAQKDTPLSTSGKVKDIGTFTFDLNNAPKGKEMEYVTRNALKQVQSRYSLTDQEIDEEVERERHDPNYSLGNPAEIQAVRDLIAKGHNQIPFTLNEAPIRNIIAARNRGEAFQHGDTRPDILSNDKRFEKGDEPAGETIDLTSTDKRFEKGDLPDTDQTILSDKIKGDTPAISEKAMRFAKGDIESMDDISAKDYYSARGAIAQDLKTEWLRANRPEDLFQSIQRGVSGGADPIGSFGIGVSDFINKFHALQGGTYGQNDVPQPSDAQIDAEIKRRQADAPYIKAIIESLQGKQGAFGPGPVGGRFAGGLLGSTIGAASYLRAGLLQPLDSLGLLDKRNIDLWRNLGNKTEYISNESAKGFGLTGEVAHVAGRAAGDVPRIIGITALMGGNVPAAMAFDAGVQSAGRGDKFGKIAFEAGKGAAFGKLLGVGSKLSALAERAITSESILSSTERATLASAMEKEGFTAEEIATATKASLEKGAASTPLETWLISKIVGEGTRLGVIGTGTYAIEKLAGGTKEVDGRTIITGASDKEARDRTIMMLIQDLAFHHGGNIPDIAGKLYRFYFPKGGLPAVREKGFEDAWFTEDPDNPNEQPSTVVSVTPEGEVREHGKDVPDRFVDASIVVDPKTTVPEIVEQAKNHPAVDAGPKEPATVQPAAEAKPEVPKDDGIIDLKPTTPKTGENITENITAKPASATDLLAGAQQRALDREGEQSWDETAVLRDQGKEKRDQPDIAVGDTVTTPKGDGTVKNIKGQKVMVETTGENGEPKTVMVKKPGVARISDIQGNRTDKPIGFSFEKPKPDAKDAMLDSALDEKFAKKPAVKEKSVFDLTKEEFLGKPAITSAANARDLMPGTLTTLENQPRVAFNVGRHGKFQAQFSPDGAVVYDGDKPIASYHFGDTLVVAPKYRRQGIATELVYQWRKRYPAPAKATGRTKASQVIQKKVWDRIESERPFVPDSQTSIAEKPKREFSSTQLDFPPDHAAKFQAWAKNNIPANTLADDGYEDQSHITALFGLHDETPEKVREALKGTKPFSVELGKVDVFKSNPDYDVVVAKAHSADLYATHDALKASVENTQTFKGYKPHATLAYVKKGSADHLIGNTDFEGQKIQFNDLTFSAKDRSTTKIPLEAKSVSKKLQRAIDRANKPRGSSSRGADPAKHSLAEFVRRQGGIKPGGVIDTKAIWEANQIPTGKRAGQQHGGFHSLINENGRTIESMFHSAVESGYLPGEMTEHTVVGPQGETAGHRGNTFSVHDFVEAVAADANKSKQYYSIDHLDNQEFLAESEDVTPEQLTETERIARFLVKPEVKEYLQTLERGEEPTDAQAQEFHQIAVYENDLSPEAEERLIAEAKASGVGSRQTTAEPSGVEPQGLIDGHEDSESLYAESPEDAIDESESEGNVDLSFDFGENEKPAKSAWMMDRDTFNEAVDDEEIENPFLFEEQPRRRDGARVPEVNFQERDLQDTVDKPNASSVLKDYLGGPYAIAYQGYVPVEDVPNPQLIERLDDNDPEGYDWSEYNPRNTFPPAKIRVNKDGTLEIIDGNHRIEYWTEGDFTHIPAWIIDERGANPALLEAIENGELQKAIDNQEISQAKADELVKAYHYDRVADPDKPAQITPDKTLDDLLSNSFDEKFAEPETSEPATTTGRTVTVTVNDKTITLTPAQEARWIAEVEPQIASAKRLRDSRIGQNRDEAESTFKGDMMRISALKREITGHLTGIEQANVDKRERSNYIGKPVSVDGRDGTVAGNPFGKVRVKFEDGTYTAYDPDKIGPPTQAAKLPYRMTRAEYAATVRQETLDRYPNSRGERGRAALEAITSEKVNKWRDLVLKAAENERIPDNVLDSMVAEYGINTVLHDFRGVREKGIEGYIPPEVRTAADFASIDKPPAVTPQVTETPTDLFGGSPESGLFGDDGGLFSPGGPKAIESTNFVNKDSKAGRLAAEQARIDEIDKRESIKAYGERTGNYLITLRNSADPDVRNAANTLIINLRRSFIDKGEAGKQLAEAVSDGLDAFAQFRSSSLYGSLDDILSQPRLDGTSYSEAAIRYAEAMDQGRLYDVLEPALQNLPKENAGPAPLAVHDLNSATDALLDLYRDEPLKMAVPIDNRYQAAKPLFLAALDNLPVKTKDPMTNIKALVDFLVDVKGMTRNQLEQMRPDIKRFISEVENGTISLKGGDDVTDSSADLEPSGNDAIGDTLGEKEPGGRSGEIDANPRPTGGKVRRSGTRPVSGPSLFGDISLDSGAQGDSRTQKDESIVNFDNTRGVEPDGSGDFSDEEFQIEPVTTNGLPDDVKSPYEHETAEDREERQRRAESITRVTPGSLDSIRETLPFLFGSQHEDVKFAEDRFLQDRENGHGVLFTNATGTGKTLLGAGIAKRMVLQGKTEGVITVPSDKIMMDWVNSAKRIGLKITPLTGTDDNGTNGVVITTYANFGQNSALAKRNWHFVVNDESHYLLSNAAGDNTLALNQLRALTLHKRGDYNYGVSRTQKERAAQNAITEAIEAHKATLRDKMPAGLSIERQKEWVKSDATLAHRAKSAALKEDFENAGFKINELTQGFANQRKALRESTAHADMPKVVMLSATPFAYVPTVEYAEGYLFDYDEGQTPDNEKSGYNTPTNREAFYINHFGFKKRYGRLERPDPGVNTALMETDFNEWLKKEKVLSQRILDVDADYQRQFIEVDSAVGNEIDRGLKILSPYQNTDPEYAALGKNLEFNYLQRRYLLEAIKAKEFTPIIKKLLEQGKKVLVYHDYKGGGGFHPFKFPKLGTISVQYKDGHASKYVPIGPIVERFEHEYPELANLPLDGLLAPILQLKQAFPDTLIFNGDIPKGVRRGNADKFNTDNSPFNSMVVQADAGREGISLHDTTGEHQRVLINLGLPVKPTSSIQIEGRIRRVGSVSDAIYVYGTTGTGWEREAFASTIAERASTAENLALGNFARGLKNSFINGFMAAEKYHPGLLTGKGGREADQQEIIAGEFERAKSYYFKNQKKSARDKSSEGTDYYATPEPIGYKAVEWTNLKMNEEALEPSAGHGAIARFMPQYTRAKSIEPAAPLHGLLGLNAGHTDIIKGTFEDHHVSNKYEGIVMNPPFGIGGKTSTEHLEKAFSHIRNGGRVTAILPNGGMSEKRIQALMASNAAKSIFPIGKVILPGVAFKRAGTGVSTSVYIFEKQLFENDIRKLPAMNIVDLSHITDIHKLFDAIENVEFPDRVVPTEPTQPRAVTGADLQNGGRGFVIPTKAEQMNQLGARAAQMATDKPVEQSFESQAVGKEAFSNFKAFEFDHTKTGKPIWATKFTKFDQSDEGYARFRAAEAIAKRHGGHYARYKVKGVEKGFYFDSAADRANFIQEAAGLFGGEESLKMATPKSDTLPTAPNGKPSNLSPDDHRIVRTPEFKAWFGDWENDPENASKVIDGNGEPLIVYHGARSGGFDVFDDQHQGADKRSGAPEGTTFFSDNRDMAATYAGTRKEQVFDGEYPSIYSVFLNIRNPYDINFEGASWDGTGWGKFALQDENGDQIYTSDGGTFFDSEDEIAQRLTELGVDRDNVAVENNPSLHLDSNSVATDVQRMDEFDGAIIRQVIDSGSESDYDFPTDVYVALKPNQIKSATANNGEFASDNDSILKQARTTDAEDAKNDIEGADLGELLKVIDPKSIERDDYRVGISDVETWEVFRRAAEQWELEKNPNLADPERFDGLFLKPGDIAGVSKILVSGARFGSRHSGLDLADRKKLVSMAKTLKEAGQAGGGTAIVHFFDDAIPHEESHRWGYMNSEPHRKLLKNRHQNIKPLVIHPTMRKMEPALEALGIRSNHMKVEEGYAWLMGGGRETLNKLLREKGLPEVTGAEADDFLADFIISFRESNPNANWDDFAKLSEYASILYDQIKEIDNQKQVASQADQTGSERGQSVEQLPDENPISERDPSDEGEGGGGPPQGYEPGGRLPERGRASELTPDGPVKLSRTPMTARANAIPLADRSYVSVTNESQKDFVDKLLDEGVDKAVAWFKDAAALNIHNNGATTAVGLSLMAKYGNNGDLANMNKIADDVVPYLTEAGQAIQAVAIVSMHDPATAGAYAAKVKLKRTGKSITQEEYDKAIAIAEESQAAAAALGKTEAKLDDALAKNKELAQKNRDWERMAEAEKNKADRARLDLTGKRDELAKLKEKIKRLLADKPPKQRASTVQHAELLKDLKGRESDIMAKIRAKFVTGPDASLKMALPADAPGADPDLIDYATLQLLENLPKGAMSLEDFKADIDTLTSGQLSDAQINEIHAAAIARIKGAKVPLDPNKKNAAKLRREHYKAADDFENRHEIEAKRLIKEFERKVIREQKAQHRQIVNDAQDPILSKLVSEILQTGALRDFSDASISHALNTDSHGFDQATGILRKNYPQYTPEQVRQVLRDSSELTNIAKSNIERSRLEDKEQSTLSDREIESIREEQRFNKTRGKKASQAATRFYAGLTDTPVKVAAEAFVNIRRAGLLTGIKTHFRNLLANTTVEMSEEMARPIQALADMAVAAKTGKRTSQGMSAAGVLAGFNAVFRQDATLKTLDINSGIQEAISIMRYGDTNEHLAKLQLSESHLGDRIGKIGTIADAYINFVFRSMSAEDAMFKVYAFRRSLEEQAKMIAVTEKREDKSVDVAKRKAELLAEPTNVMQLNAHDFADQLTFQDDNAITNFTKVIRNYNEITKVITAEIAPFDRTPTNIILRTLEHSPAGFAKAFYHLYRMNRPTDKQRLKFNNRFRKAVSEDAENANENWEQMPPNERRRTVDDMLNDVFTERQQREFAKAFGRASIGTAGMALGFAAAAAGILAGVLQPDDDDRDETSEFFGRRKKGIENRSIWTPAGRLVLPDDPWMRALTLGATIHDQAALLEKRKKNAWLATIGSTAEAYYDLSTTQPLIDSSTNYLHQIKKGKYGEMLGGFVASHIPTIAADAGDALDPKARTGSSYIKGQKFDPYDPAQQLRGLTNQITRRVPILRNYVGQEDTGAPGEEERGGLARRSVRSMIDVFNSRSPELYQAGQFIGKPPAIDDRVRAGEISKDDAKAQIKKDLQAGKISMAQSKEMTRNLDLSAEVKTATHMAAADDDDFKRIDEFVKTVPDEQRKAVYDVFWKKWENKDKAGQNEPKAKAQADRLRQFIEENFKSERASAKAAAEARKSSFLSRPQAYKDDTAASEPAESMIQPEPNRSVGFRDRTIKDRQSRNVVDARKGPVEQRNLQNDLERRRSGRIFKPIK